MDSVQSRRSTGGSVHRHSSHNGNGKNLIRTETCPNGRASYVVLDNEDFGALCTADRERLVDEYFRQAFSVDDDTGMPRHVMAIVRGGAAHLADPLRYLAENEPHVKGQCRKMHRPNMVESVNIADYYRTVQASIAGNCTRADPLNSISLVGTVSEEIGGHFPKMLSSLEDSPFLRATLPWGRYSKLKLGQPTESNDGPILWVRPGEQMIPSDQLVDQHPAKRARKSVASSLTDLYSQKRCINRETLFEDRTYCHADQVTDGARQTTCAVGLLKAVTRDGKPAPENLVVKDVIAFSATCFNQVVSAMQIDLWEPPVSQCKTWVCLGKLNALHAQLGDELRYARIKLRADDIYFIPRHVVHQFQTAAACTSIAWHLRYDGYAGLPQFDVPSLLPPTDDAMQPAATATAADEHCKHRPQKLALCTRSPSAVKGKRRRTHRSSATPSPDRGDASLGTDASPTAHNRKLAALTTHDAEPAANNDSKRRVPAPEPTANNDSKRRVPAPEPTTNNDSKRRVPAPEPTANNDSKRRVPAPEPTANNDSKRRVPAPEPTTNNDSKRRVPAPEPTTSNDSKRRVPAPTAVLSVGKRSASTAAAASSGEATAAASSSASGRCKAASRLRSSTATAAPAATSFGEATAAAAANSSSSGRRSVKSTSRSLAAASAPPARPSTPRVLGKESEQLAVSTTVEQPTASTVDERCVDLVPPSPSSCSPSIHAIASPQPTRIDAEVKQENGHSYPSGGGSGDGSDSDGGGSTSDQQLVASCKPLFVPPVYLTAQQQQSSSRQSSSRQSLASLHA